MTAGFYVSDWSAGEVIAVDLVGGAEVVARVNSLPLCTAWLPDGTLVIVAQQEALLLRLAADGSLGTHANLGRPGSVALVRPDGSVHEVADDITFPTG